MRIPRFLLTVAFVPLAAAQEGSVGGPSLGLLYDTSARSLHRVNGVPAAALLSEALPGGDGLAWLAAAPGGGYALGVSEQTGLVELVTATGRASLEALPAGVTGARFSPTGRAALLLLEGRALAVKLSGETMEAGWEFAADPGTALAISDDGQAALALAGGRLALHRAGGTVEHPALEQVRAAAFVEGGQDLVALTEEDGVAFLQRGGEWSRVALPEGLARPVAVAATADYLLAVTEDGLLARVSGDGTAVETIACACTATTLARMGRAHLYRLNEAGEGPVWLLDASEAQPRILFLPPVVKEAE